MSKATKAALFSALILPGAGHFILKAKAKAYILFTLVLGCLAIIVNEAIKQAQTIVQEIERGGGNIDINQITELVTQSTQQSNSALMTAASFVLIACWLFGVIDSFRLGSRQA